MLLAASKQRHSAFRKSSPQSSPPAATLLYSYPGGW